jgi:hypothetical protein
MSGDSMIFGDRYPRDDLSEPHYGVGVEYELIFWHESVNLRVQSEKQNMNRRDVVLAALAAGGQGSSYPPAQVQKLFFLIDREAASGVGGPHFNFAPYDYGPFDSAVYDTLDALERSGMVEKIQPGKYRRYRLTKMGHERGMDALRSIDQSTAKYFADAAAWVNSLSFQQLVSAIYKHYPEMKARSIFQG